MRKKIAVLTVFAFISSILIASSITDLSGGGDSLPDQSGNSGKYLTTDGSSASWASLSGSGITSLGGLTGATQTFAVGTSGTDFAVSSSGTTHTFNLPDAGASARGAVTTGAQIFAGAKRFQDNLYVGTAPGTAIPLSIDSTPTLSSGTYQTGTLIGRRTVSTSDSNTTTGLLAQTLLTVSAGQSSQAQASGCYGQVKADGAGTTALATGVRSDVQNIGTGGITDAASLFAGTIGNTGGGSIVNTYGLLIRDNTVGSTANYPIYSEGTKESYFVAGSSLASGKFFVSNNGDLNKIDNVYYNWPGSQGSASTYLKNDGSGNLSWAAISGAGDVVGPASSVDGELATMDGTTGKLIRSESKFKVASTTGEQTQTWTGTPTQLITKNIGTATNWTSVNYTTGTIASTPGHIYIDYADPSLTLSGSRIFTMSRMTPTISGSTTARVVREYDYIPATASGAAWGAYNVDPVGLFGYSVTMNNSSTTGGAGSFNGAALGNQALFAAGVGVSSVGSSGKAGGITGKATTSNSPSIAFGGYFALDANWDSGTETEVWANDSAALIANNGDTTKPVFIGQDNGSSVFQIQDGGHVVLGANGGTSTHTLNGNAVVTGQMYSEQDTETQAASTANTIDWNDGNSTEWDLQAATGNITLTMSNPKKGASYVIKIIQSSTARTITWPSDVKWANGTAPTLSTTNDAIDVISFYYDGNYYLGTYATGFQ